MKKYFIFFLILTITIGQLNYVVTVNQNELNQIRTGANFANSLAKAMQSKIFPDVITKAASIIPGISAVASFVGFILSLVGTSPSQELLAVKQLFNEMDRRFDSLERDLQDIQRTINWASIQSQYSHIEQEINTVYDFLKSIYTSPLASRNNEKDYFIKSYESTCTTCAMDLYHGIMGTDSALTGDIFRIATDSFQNDRNQTQNFMIGILQVLLRGINSELAYRKLKYGDSNYNLHLHDWEQRIRNVTNRLQTIDEQVKGKYHDQAGKDIDRIAAEQETLSNEDFSIFLYNFLKKKYYWRDWLVLIYKPINGGGSHMNQQCDGFIKYRFHGRNMVVASVDSTKNSIDITQAKSIISALQVTYLAPGTRYGANDVYNAFPANIKSSCSSYAANGVIDIHSDIKHQAPPNRLVITAPVGFNDKPYVVYLFG